VNERLLFTTKLTILQLYHGVNKLHIGDIYGVSFLLDQYAKLYFISASSLKQQFVGRHVTPLRIYPDSEPTRVCSFSFSDTHFIVFGVTRLGFETTTYLTRRKHFNHTFTDVGLFKCWQMDKRLYGINIIPIFWEKKFIFTVWQDYWHYVLAHLIQRIMWGIVITYRPSSSSVNFYILIFFSETKGLVRTNFGKNVHWMLLLRS